MPNKLPTETTDVVTRAVRDLQRDPPPRTPLTGTQVVAGAASGNRERSLAARPDCAVCGRPVESFTEEVQEHVQYVVFTARCHGRSERVRVEREVVECAGPGGVRFGLAFVPPNTLPAAPAPKLLGPGNGST